MLTILTTTLAHAGHDHTLAPGGQWHHYVWAAAAAALVIAGLWAAFRRTKG